MDINEVKERIAEIIFEVTGIHVEQTNDHLLSMKYRYRHIDFLYVFDRLENEFSIPVSLMLETYDYTIFSIDRIAEEMMKMMADKGRCGIESSPELIGSSTWQ